jgi:hypothetical protein
MKRELLERGTHIPLIVRLPGAKQAGTIDNKLISAVDFAPTVLSIANIKVPAYMQGQAFLGNQAEKEERKYVFAARDRMDSEYDRVRMVRDKQFRYLYNYMPEKPYYQQIEYRLQVPMMLEILKLKEEGKLSKATMSWFNTKPVEELYDIEKDPYELHNLAGDPKYGTKLKELRTALKDWTNKVGDMGGMSEPEMVKQMWNGKDRPPITAQPQLIVSDKGIKITCDTKGASIGYRIQKAGATPAVAKRPVTSWDSGTVDGKLKNGELKQMTQIWKVYTGEWITLLPDEALYVNAMRIGFTPSELSYTNGKIIK